MNNRVVVMSDSYGLRGHIGTDMEPYSGAPWVSIDGYVKGFTKHGSPEPSCRAFNRCDLRPATDVDEMNAPNSIRSQARILARLRERGLVTQAQINEAMKALPPKVLFINSYENGPLAHTTEELARQFATGTARGVAVPYIELTPEVEAACKAAGIGAE